jgi:hypothetical protein
MEFSKWLNENESKIMFGGFFSDGRVIVYINRKRYVFVTPAWYHERWKKLSNFAPFKVLNQIKKQIKNGESWLLEPSIPEK